MKPPEAMDRLVDKILANKPMRKKKPKQKVKRGRKSNNSFKAAISFFLLSFMCHPVYARNLAQSPRQSENNGSAEVQSNGNNNQAPPNTSTPSVKANSTNGSYAQTGEPQSKDQERSVKITDSSEISVSTIKALSDYLLIVFTGLLVAVGGGQIFLLRRTVKATSDNATAAKTSAESLIAIERAWIMMDTFPNQMYYNGGAPEGELPPRECIKLKNYGRTPAFITEYAYKFALLDREIFENDLEYPEPAILPDGEPVPPGEYALDWPVRFQPNVPLTHEDFSKIESGDKVLTLYGHIKYRAIFPGETGGIRFCFRRVFKTNIKIPPYYCDGWSYDTHPERNNQW
jgi:hypothetical protein